jgi:hypothetical protein
MVEATLSVSRSLPYLSAENNVVNLDEVLYVDYENVDLLIIYNN